MPVVTIAMLQAARNHSRSNSTGGVASCHSFHFTRGTFVPRRTGMATRPFSRASRAMPRLSGFFAIGVDRGSKFVNHFVRLSEPLSLAAEAPVVRQVTENAVRNEAVLQERRLRLVPFVLAPVALAVAEVAVIHRLDNLAAAVLANRRC